MMCAKPLALRRSMVRSLVSVLISNLNPSGSFNLLARFESWSRERSVSTSVAYDSMTQVFPSGECNRKTLLPFAYRYLFSRWTSAGTKSLLSIPFISSGDIEAAQVARTP